MDAKRFPSPYGDMVLKSCVLQKGAREAGTVSVPLRGYGFEITRRQTSQAVFAQKVSVPLRGYGFEMMKCYPDGSYRGQFPSPYGDMVLK